MYVFFFFTGQPILFIYVTLPDLTIFSSMKGIPLDRYPFVFSDRWLYLKFNFIHNIEAHNML